MDKKSTSASVKFAHELEEDTYINDNESMEPNEYTLTTDINITRLTNKKK
jgi:hypothetical protein